MIQLNNDTETTAEKLYDICMIERLCRGNQDQVKKMVKVFIEQLPMAVEEIKQAYSNGDYTAVRNTTHRIKPTLSYYAIVKIEKDIQQIEALAKAGFATPELESKIAKVEYVVSGVVEKMKTDYLYY